VSESIREGITRILAENGFSENYNPHSWRCEHPDRYGACDCVEQTVNDLVEFIEKLPGETHPEAVRASQRGGMQ